MVTLIQAFKMCNIGEEMVYIREYKEEPDRPWDRGHAIWSKKIRDRLDMKKIAVIKILPAFSYSGYEGFSFVVRGVDADVLRKLELSID